MLYDEVLTSGEPDAVYEFFWLMFKDSVKNFNDVLKRMNTPPVTQLSSLAEEVPGISSTLNNLKKEKKYAEIIREIDVFLVKFAWSSLLTIDTPECSYHINIVNTNINRWLNLPGIKETEQFAALHVLLGLATKNATQNDLVKYTRGTPDTMLDVIKVVSRATKFSLVKNRPTALTRLTNHVILQPIVVDVLRDIGLDAPMTIRCGQKIIKMYEEAIND